MVASPFFALARAGGGGVGAMHVQVGEHTALLPKNEHGHVEGSFKAAVFGFSDGLTTSINLVLGVALTRQTHSDVVLTGVAGLFAGASSMACGEWLSAKAEEDCHAAELKREAWHLQAIPREEAAHMRGILMAHGLSGATADAVNRDVAALPLARQVAFHGKFELGIDVDDRASAWRNAAAMWLAFCVGAIIPLAPWLLTADFATATAGTVGGSAAGLVAVSAYQARGAGSRACGSCTLARVLLRQAVVTSLAVGLTVLFDMLFV